MGLKAVAPGVYSRTRVSGDSLGNSRSEYAKPDLRVGRKIESEYYAQRAAEAEARRLNPKSTKPDRRRVDAARFELACHVLWLQEHGFYCRTIWTALNLKPSFVNNVVNCASIQDAVAVEPPAEMIAKCQAVKDASK